MSDRKKWQRPALGLTVFTLVVLSLIVFPSMLQGRTVLDWEPVSARSAADEVTNAAFCDYVTQIPKAECQALVELHSYTNGASWWNKTGWLMTYTPCSWHGLSCSGGHVVRLDLCGNRLAGNLPFSLGNLSHLQELSTAHLLASCHEKVKGAIA